MLEEIYDVKLYEFVLYNIYFYEEDIFKEMRCFESVLLKYGVQVYCLWILENCNQVFVCDVGFVIDDKIIVFNIIFNWEDEKEVYEVVYNQIVYNKIFNFFEKVYVEGGDVVFYNNIVFVGFYIQFDYLQMKMVCINWYVFFFLKEICLGKIFIFLELKKYNIDLCVGILYLDCIFMLVGKGYVIIYKDGFMYFQDYYILFDLFGRENVFEIMWEEMYYMNMNVFFIFFEVVVFEKNFICLNIFMEEVWGMMVECVFYYEIFKMGGLLCCFILLLI